MIASGRENMYQINSDKELQKILDKLDALPRHERLSCIENDVEVLVKQFRDSLNKDLIEKLNKKVSNEGPVPCEKGHNLYSMGVKKKDFS